MKNRIFSLVLAVLMVLTMSVSISALDAPAPGGDHIFGADRMMQFDAGTRFHNGIVNGGIINPGTGAPSTYAGVKFDIDTYKGEKCVKVELLEEKVTGYFDFNYYQWNAEYYNPSLDSPKYPWLRVRYAYNDSAADIDCMKFYASKDSPVLGVTVGAGMKIFDIANGNGEWMDTVVNLEDIIYEDGTAWSETTIRQFRLYMFEYNENPEAVCYIAGFGFFETEEEAKSYDFASGASTAPVTPPAQTEAKTEAPTEAKTEAPTEAKTEAPTEEATEAVDATEATEATEEATEATEETADEEATTEEGAEEVTDEATEEATEEVEATEEATEEKTEKSEEATEKVEEPAEESSNTGIIVGVVAAVVVVIALVAFLVSKKKK